jgi:UDP-N-acetylglucosamine 4-epimerase
MNYPSYADQTFLVTGGAGFIGSNLVEALLGLGATVRVLDDFSTGKMENLKAFNGHPKLRIDTGSIQDLDACRHSTDGVDYVLHHAALGSVPKSIEDPHLTNAINVDGTLNMLIAARDCGVKRFVYASSSAVYGDQETSPQVEGREGSPLSPYAVSKKINELYANNFTLLYGLETIGLRYFNVFGKRQDPQSIYAAVMPIFVEKLLKDEAPVIFGDGLQTRDFTHVDNVIEANLKACAAPSTACGQAYNIAYGETSTMNAVYATLVELMGKSIAPRYTHDRAGDIKHSSADIARACEMLGYRPKVSMIEGLKESISWYEANL